MHLKILTGDFETFYSDDYSLRKMTPVEYICDPRFECLGGSFRMDEFTLPVDKPPSPYTPSDFDAKARWVDGRNVTKLFEKVDWTKTAFMSHNIGFDGAILAWRYGIVPALYIDTLGMGRAMLPEAKGASLEKALIAIGAPPKGDEIANAKGMRLADLERHPSFYTRFQRYASRDCDGALWLFRHLAHGFAGTLGVGTIHKSEEFLLMDAVARMTILPQFILDRDVLHAHHTNTVKQKVALLDKLKGSAILDPDNPKGDLMSNARFADVLRKLGVEPPTKISFKTGKQTFAFSKTDPAFMELMDDEDPLVQACVAARLGYKSTLEETRTQRFLNISDLTWPPQSDSTVAESLRVNTSVTGQPLSPRRMPFPLRYSGAHTHRLSGEWSLNLQNLGRKSQLRASLAAPPGYKIVSADASQIEARIVSWLAGCAALVNAFEDKEDVYSTFASLVYGYLVNKKDHPGERFVGKTAVLGLGFGMGWAKFILTCLNQGRAQGLPREMCVIPEALGRKTVETYRTSYHEVPSYWRAMDQVIEMLANRVSGVLGPILIDGPNQSLILPNGMRLYYHNMRSEIVPGLDGKPRQQWLFDYGRETKYTFGGKMTENVVQALARIITMNAAARIRRKAQIGDWRPRHLAGQIHDQLIYVVPDEVAHDFRDLVVAEMSARLDWFKSLPLAAEGEIGQNLLEAK